MSRLIDADALREEIVTIFHGITATGFIRYMRDKSPIDVYNKILKVIDNAPTANITEQITIKCDTEEEKQKLLSALRNARLTICEEAENDKGRIRTR